VRLARCRAVRVRGDPSETASGGRSGRRARIEGAQDAPRARAGVMSGTLCTWTRIAFWNYALPVDLAGCKYARFQRGSGVLPGLVLQALFRAKAGAPLQNLSALPPCLGDEGAWGKVCEIVPWRPEPVRRARRRAEADPAPRRSGGWGGC